METINGAASSTSITTESYDTALCIIPPPWQCQSIDRLRSLYDKSYGKWPSHINLIYPFVSVKNLPIAKSLIQSHLSRQYTEATLNVVLDQVGHFTHRKNCTVFLAELQSAEETQLEALRTILFKALGQDPKPSRLHLTVGQSEGRVTPSADVLLNKAKLLPQLKFQVFSLAILIREHENRQGNSTSRMRLWNTIDISASFGYRPGNTQGPSVPTPVGSLIETLPLSNSAYTFNDHIQPEITYCFDIKAQSWQPSQEIPHQDGFAKLSIASYNVLFELDSAAPAEERYPLLVSTIFSESTKADVVVLQEVTDSFLSYLLSTQDVQQHYRFASRGPPQQSDIGPLPNICNIVILSRYYLTWKTLRFPERHKDAAVATLHVLPESEQYTASPPLILAGVHLTCGVTDQAVASKQVQLSTLIKHLSETYPANPWIVAGDFNIPTSSYTIDNALTSKSISEHTTEIISNMEANLTEVGLLDTWAVKTEGEMEQLDDLYDGEYGATFDPRTNGLAAATCRTSSNRPQRYDRILLRSRGSLEVESFNLFGLPQKQGSVQSTPSDHFGIRATFRVMDNEARKSNIVTDLLARSVVQWKRAKNMIADTKSLILALKTRNMFPSEMEVTQRNEAFKLIKGILLGDSETNEASATGVSMAVVAVGSYALETWTSASDIDCLCVGSMSSKNFFNLARERIAEANIKGAYVLRTVEARTGTMLELLVNGVYMDLQYCPAAKLAERWSGILDLDPSDNLFNLPMLARRKLKPFRDISYIQQSLPSLPTFRLAYRCIKLWAIQHGMYSAKFGYLGGIHITLMLTSVYMRLAHDVGAVTANDLIVTFFKYYSEFDWRNDVVFDSFFHKEQPQYQRKAREPMVILGFHSPNSNVAHTATSPGLEILIAELKTASQRLAYGDMTWSQFFTDATLLQSGDASAAKFLYSYDTFVQITVHYWGPSSSRAKSLLGWVESRSISLVVDIDRVLSNSVVQIWPARFTHQDNNTDSEGDYQGCYLIGIAVKGGKSRKHDEKDRLMTDAALLKVVNRFQDQLQATDTEYDPGVSWIDISIAEASQVKGLALDTREWGDYTVGIDYLPDEDKDEDDDNQDAPVPNNYQNSRHNNVVFKKKSATSKLRPASDILSRLKWDPSFNSSDYAVGYEDRFLGARETNLEKWKMEQTDEEFIPQHRILYFKNKKTGIVVWERQTRTDMIFNSGATASRTER